MCALGGNERFAKEVGVKSANERGRKEMKMVIQTCCATLMVVLGVGCASTRQVVPFPDQSVQVEDPSMARIYVLRPSTYGGAISMRVLDDDELIGRTGPRGFLCWEREPGEIEVVGRAENTFTLPISLEAGEVYYIEQRVRMGLLSARNQLDQLSEERGKLLLERCREPIIEVSD